MAGQRHTDADIRTSTAAEPTVDLGGLSNVIRGVIVPSLLSSYVAVSSDHRALPRRGRFGVGSQAAVDELPDPNARPVLPEHVDALCGIVLRDDLDGARQLVEQLARDGAPVSDLLAKLIAPSAMTLGGKWLDSDCSFVDVTLGLGIFQILLRDVCGTAAFDTANSGAPLQLRCFAMLPEMHTLGNLITGEMFRAAGWSVVSNQPVTHESLIAEVRQAHFDVIGISVSSVEFLDDVEALALSIREASLNPNAFLVAGGNAFARREPSGGSFEGIDRVVHDVADVEALIADLSSRLNRARSLARVPY
jgi:methylmalonyl-CoA mutase cobalamin-binding subunit